MQSTVGIAHFLVLVLVAVRPFNEADALVCQGCLELDDLTFDSVVSRFETVLVKFDIQFPYGDKHTAYEQFARELKTNDVIAAAVSVKSAGKPAAGTLAERFIGVIDQLPVIKLFNSKDASKWIDYPFGKPLAFSTFLYFCRRLTLNRDCNRSGCACLMCMC